jgi:hypothetical protein
MDKMKFGQLETELPKEKKTEEAMERIEKEDFKEVLDMEIEKEEKELEGVFSKFSSKTKKAMAVAVLGLSLFGASVSEARNDKTEIGKAVERGISSIIRDAARGIGRAVENIGERMGGENPREQERRIQEIQREDRDYHRQAEEARDNFMRVMQGRWGRGESAGLGAEYREIAIKNYKLTITAINDAHKTQHEGVTGCRYPDGFSTEFVKTIEQLEKF